MKVAFWAPLPPARSGVADYAAALLTALRRRGEIVSGAEHADAALYHIGNNQLHREIYRRALERPGITVLHDAVLHHFFLGSLSRDAYLEEFVYNYGEWHRGTAEALWAHRAGSALDRRYFEYAMVRRIAGSSRAVVVHNPGAAEIVRRHAPEARILEIPHLFAPPGAVSVAEAMRYRACLGIPPGAFVFGVLGYLRESKRLMPVLRAFGRVRRERPEALLLVAGDFVSSDLERAAAPFLRSPGIARLPHLAAREFWLAAHALDACISLRHPAAGETSGITVRLMGIGKPVLLTDAPENARYPAPACLRIPAGPCEEDALQSHMLLLLSSKETAREIGRLGAAHVRLRHSVETAAGLYWDTLCEYRC